MAQRLLVMGSPPTSNGDLHLGHLAGPYLSADVFARYQRMKGLDVIFTTGSDDHQSYVVRKSEALGTSPRETAEMFSDRIRKTLALAAIEPDVFTPSGSSTTYRSFVTAFFEELRRRGRLEAADAPVLYCPSCLRHLFGADVAGRCGHCSEPCDGALCEACGHPVSAEKLADPRCGRCRRPAQVRSVRQLVFRLQDFTAQLGAYHSTQRMRRHPYEQVEAMLAEGLPDVAVGHPGDWGIPVPVPGFGDQMLEVWAEVGPGYQATTQELTAGRNDPAGWQKFWCDDEAKIVQFFGFDNTFAHTLLHPALLMAHGGLRPPDRFVINEFYRLDGLKFSSSRSHAVWGGEILTRVPSDLVRYYLCFTAPETRQENFSLESFQEKVNRNLAGVVQRTINHLFNALGAQSPYTAHPAGIRTAPAEQSFDPLAKMTQAAAVMGEALEAETFSLQKAVRIWREMIVQLDGHWIRIETDRARGMTDGWFLDAHDRTAAALTVVCSCAYPLMPEFAQRLWSAMSIERPLKTHEWGKPVFLPRDRSFKTVLDPWFPEVLDINVNMTEPLPLTATG